MTWRARNLPLAVLLVGLWAGCGPQGSQGAGDAGPVEEWEEEEGCQPEDCPSGQVCADGACVVPPTCSPDNCDGCCQGDTCLPGHLPGTCGIGGAGCQKCSSTSVCEAGVCEQVCGPDTCKGCCDPVMGCIEGTDIGGCGIDGEMCSDCGADATCSQGQCIANDCFETCDGCCVGNTCVEESSAQQCGADGNACVACPGSSICQEGQCVIDPDSRWDLVLINGEVEGEMHDGASWDAFGGAPDPYLELLFEPNGGQSVSYTTATRNNTLVPEWNETVLLNVKASDLLSDSNNTITYRLWDEDVSYDDRIGACVGAGYEAGLFGSIIQVTCPENANSNNSGWVLRFRLE